MPGVGSISHSKNRDTSSSWLLDTSGYPSSASALDNYYRSGGWLADIFTGGAMGNAIVQDATNNYNRMLYDNYQSPAAMRSQYEQAGINYNYAEHGAHGNIQPASAPSAANRTISNVVSAASLLNTFLGAMSEGAGLITQISGIPYDIALKRWASILKGNQASKEGSLADSAAAKAIFDNIFYKGADFGSSGSYSMNGISYNYMNSPALQQAGLRNSAMQLMNDLRKYDLNHMRPAQLDRLNSELNLLALKSGFMGKQINWFDASSLGKVLAPFLGFLLRAFI